MSFISIQERFEQMVRKHPQREAVHWRGQAMTYAELERTANQQAHALQRAGMGRESLVAVLTENPFQRISAMLAIFKISALFLPLDARFPGERLKAMLGTAMPAFCFVEAEMLAKLDAIVGGTDAPVMVHVWGEAAHSPERLSPIDFPMNEEDPGPPPRTAAPDDPCYLYFTSGSSGEPKAVTGRLGSLGHFIDWEITTFALDASCRVSHLASPAFDASLRDYWTPLCSGGSVHAPDSREVLLHPQKLLDWIDEQRLTLVHCVPSLFRTLLDDSLTARPLDALRFILLSGETILPGDVRRWNARFGESVQLVNLYGQTETTMTKFCYWVQPSDSGQSTIPIGQPIGETAALVVDEKGRPCPSGVVGEILIRTPHRSLGYYQRPDLTERAFIPNPFSSQDPKDLVYKTGDFGRALPDGNYELLGRKDQQVKIRGQRVEMGELEQIIGRHPLVRETAVVEHPDAEGNLSLCAYVVSSEELPPQTLKAFMADYLPDGMLPSFFVTMDSLPKNPIGKIDRAALPNPEQVYGKQGENIRDPANWVEEKLVEVFAEVLGLPQIGVDDNFFELGGHSLLAMRVVTRVKALFDVELMVPHFFDAPTVTLLAKQIETVLWARQGASPEGGDAEADRELLDIEPAPQKQRRFW